MTTDFGGAAEGNRTSAIVTTDFGGAAEGNRTSAIVTIQDLALGWYAMIIILYSHTLNSCCISTISCKLNMVLLHR